MESSPSKKLPNGKGPKNNKHEDKFKYGNYRSYYNKRLGNEEVDVRLKLMEQHPELFKDKRLLDIGCNSGYITMNLARKFQPKSILGVDIDKELVNYARQYVERKKLNPNLTQEQINALNSVIFRTANYILKNHDLLELEKPAYDTILCLSITKWIQLNFGDDGIKFMFKRIFKQLNPNGVLILEAQPFSTYKKRSKVTPEILENYKKIELKPDKFEAYLLSDEVGFAESWCMSDESILKQVDLPKGFNRTLQVFVKK